MSQNLSNFAQRTTLAQQVAGECVAELVGAFSRPINPCLGHEVPNQRTDGPLIFETHQWRFDAEKQAPGIRTLGPARFQV